MAPYAYINGKGIKCGLTFPFSGLFQSFMFCFCSIETMIETHCLNTEAKQPKQTSLGLCRN
jgi:hypothetical protein